MIETRAGPLQILALPWITRHNLLTKEELRLASLLEIETLLHGADRVLRTTAEALEPDFPTVLTIHGTIDGATVGAERQFMLGKDLVLPKSFVALPGVDYVAMGDIHSTNRSAPIRRLSTPVVSSGSTSARSTKTRAVCW